MGLFSKLFNSIEPAIINLDGKIITVSNRNEAEFYGGQLLRILNDCANLVNTTKNPKVFFERYDLLIKSLENLSRLERFNCFSGPLPSHDLQETLSKKNFTINDFIDRYYQDTINKIQNLKTQKAKDKKIEDFYQELVNYNSCMLPINIQRYNYLYNSYKNK